jgi:hypothetical protein
MIKRRSLIEFMSAAASSGWRAGVCAEDGSDKGLFWRLEIPDKRTAIVFGAWTTTASLVPRIVVDGYRYVDATHRIIAIDRVAEAKAAGRVSSDCGETRLGLNRRLAEV